MSGICIMPGAEEEQTCQRASIEPFLFSPLPCASGRCASTAEASGRGKKVGTKLGHKKEWCLLCPLPSEERFVLSHPETGHANCRT